MDGYKRSNAYIATQGEQLLTQTMVLLLSIFIYSPWCNTQLGVTMAWQILCSAGPLPKTFGDFWRMVWEQMVLIIVMTTRWGSFASDFWSQLCDRDAKLVFRYRSGGPRSNLSLNAKKKSVTLCVLGWWNVGVSNVVSTGLLRRAGLSSMDTSWSGTHTSRCFRTSNSPILNFTTHR